MYSLLPIAFILKIFILNSVPWELSKSVYEEHPHFLERILVFH